MANLTVPPDVLARFRLAVVQTHGALRPHLQAEAGRALDAHAARLTATQGTAKR